MSLLLRAKSIIGAKDRRTNACQTKKRSIDVLNGRIIKFVKIVNIVKKYKQAGTCIGCEGIEDY
jgi:hypothetical protein